MAEREDGLYWVKPPMAAWEIAQWEEDRWVRTLRFGPPLGSGFAEIGERVDPQPQPTGWKSISEAPPEIVDAARCVRPVGLGEFVGRCYMLRDRSWVVFKFSNPPGELESYYIVPEPPR